MTSKISFSKLCKENLRHYSAVIVITLFAFLIQILMFVLEIQNTLTNTDLQNTRMQDYINSHTEPGFVMGFFAMAIAMMLAFNGFRFLHSKKQTDFYGSLPIKRNTLFRMILLDSFLIFFVPLIISTIIEILITVAIGYCSAVVVKNLLLVILCMTVAFLVTWATAALAMIMTGHSFIALLGFGVFSTYAPLILRYLIPTYAGTFYETYTFSSLNFWALNYFSPFSLIYGLTADNQNWKFSAHSHYFWATVAIIIAVSILAYVLFLRRPAEAAGRAMAFQKANPVIRLLLVIPLALYTGIYLNQMTLGGSLIWLFIGIILGTFIFHGIVECIYQFDIRALISHKKQLGASLIICLVFTGIFMTDAFGYNTYLPKKDELKSMSISLSNYPLPDEFSYWGKTKDGISGEQMETALLLIKDLINENKDSDTASFSLNGVISADSDDPESSLSVTYVLKNGKTRQRQYTFNTTEHSELLDKLFAAEDFKNDIYSLYTADRSKITKLEWDNCIDFETLKFTAEEQEEFLNTYLEELTALTYSDLKNTCPTSEFILSHSSSNSYGNTEETYYIYPSFQKTIEFLQKHGIPAGTSVLENYTLAQIELSVSDEDYENVAKYQITNPEILETFKNKLQPNSFAEFIGYDDHYGISVKVTDSRGTYTLDMCVDEETGKKLHAAAEDK